MSLCVIPQQNVATCWNTTKIMVNPRKASMYSIRFDGMLFVVCILLRLHSTKIFICHFLCHVHAISLCNRRIGIMLQCPRLFHGIEVEFHILFEGETQKTILSNIGSHPTSYGAWSNCQLMAADQEIIELRSKVRKAAESKLRNGIIDVNDLLREINAENAARVQQSMHEIEMLKEIYNLSYTLNN